MFEIIVGVIYKTFQGKMRITSRKLPQTEVCVQKLHEMLKIQCYSGMVFFSKFKLVVFFGILE